MSSNQNSTPPPSLDEESKDDLSDEEIDLGSFDFSKEIIDLEEFKNNLLSFPSERLCEIVVSFRYLNILEQEAIVAMNELAVRRQEGDTFNYEEKIEEMLSTLPKVNMDLAKVLRSIKI